MRWKFLHRTNTPDETNQDEPPDTWQRHVQTLREAGIPKPGAAVQGNKPVTLADEQALYAVAPSFVDLLPWVEYLPDAQCMLLEDGNSVAACK